MNSIVVKRFDCLICIIYCGMMIAIKCQLSFISQSKLSDVISFHPSKKSIWVGWVELHFAFFQSSDPRKVGCSTIVSSTIHFDLVRLSCGLRSTKLNIALMKHNLSHEFCSKNLKLDSICRSN